MTFFYASVTEAGPAAKVALVDCNVIHDSEACIKCLLDSVSNSISIRSGADMTTRAPLFAGTDQSEQSPTHLALTLNVRSHSQFINTCFIVHES